MRPRRRERRRRRQAGRVAARPHPHPDWLTGRLHRLRRIGNARGQAVGQSILTKYISPVFPRCLPSPSFFPYFPPPEAQRRLCPNAAAASGTDMSFTRPTVDPLPPPPIPSEASLPHTALPLSGLGTLSQRCWPRYDTNSCCTFPHSCRR